jgi:TIR domain-containing protein
VKAIDKKLKERGILPWQLPLGQPWLPVLEKQIGKIKSAAVFVSKNDMGPWKDPELCAILAEFVTQGRPIIPVLLPGARRVSIQPQFLKGRVWVDFNVLDPDPMEQLISGITGEQSL